MTLEPEHWQGRQQAETPLIPVRMLNEHVYCPRLAYLMWVQGEFEHNDYTVEGTIRHRRVDGGGGKLPPEPSGEDFIHARSVSLSSESLKLTAKIDLVEGKGNVVSPVDYKRGKRPHVEGGAYEPERVQVCAQGLLLREHGFSCDEGVLYFVASKERVHVPLDEALVNLTMAAIGDLLEAAAGEKMPSPLEDSPKCPRCSLVGICLPDEVRFLEKSATEPRPISVGIERGFPLYVQSGHAYVRKDGERLIIEENKEAVASARLHEVSQVALFGASALSTPALHELMRRNIPVTYMTYGGWFVGHTIGTGHKNVETRICQYRTAADKPACLRLAKGLVVAKIQNCRTLLRRNWRGGCDDGSIPEDDEQSGNSGTLLSLKEDSANALRAASLGQLLGIEGTAACRYFQNFSGILKADGEPSIRFDFNGRNRRPPLDPVNAMLSFGYSMLAREWTTALSAVGLDPYLGFYHQPRFGRPALSLDMMEPFRPLVADSVVIMAINNGEVKASDFVSRAGSCNLTDSGRKSFIAAFERRMGQEVTHPVFKYKVSYRRLFEVQARLLIRHLSGEIPEYPQFTTR